jgi:hypothetical protein
MAHQAPGIFGITAGQRPRYMFLIFGQNIDGERFGFIEKLMGNRALVHTDQQQQRIRETDVTAFAVIPAPHLHAPW